MGAVSRWNLALGAAVLALGLVGAELLGTVGINEHAPVVRAADVVAAPPELARQAPRAERGGTAATLLARPLFNLDRRPVTGEAAAVATRAALPRLTAIIRAPGLRQAVFVAPGSDRPVRAAEGDVVGEYHVTAVGAESVELLGASGHATVRLEADEAYRGALAEPPAPLQAQLIDPARRESEFESDQ